MKLLLKEALKKIKLTFGRFLSVFFIVALGVGFFAGIRNTCDDMLYTASSYYEEKNLMDLRLVSTLGFTEDDVKLLENIDSVKNVKASYYLDCLEGSSAVRVLAITNQINKTTLIDGRMPKATNEVLADSMVYKVGDKLTLNTDDLKEKEVEVVGTIESPMYIQFTNKGTTLIGNGKINAFIYMLEDNFDMEAYTVIYLTGNNMSDLRSYTDRYDTSLEKLKDDVDNHLEQLKTRRQNELKEEANKKLEEARSKIEEEEKKNQQELANTKDKLDATNVKLQKLEKKINDNENVLKQETKKAQKELQSAKEQLEKSKEEYQSYLEQYNKYKGYLDYLNSIYNPLPDIDDENNDPEQRSGDNLNVDAILEEIRNSIDFTSEEELLGKLNQIVVELSEKLSIAQQEISQAEELIGKQEQLLKDKILENKQVIAKYKEELESGYKKLEDGYKTYHFNYNKFEVKFQDAYKQLDKEAKKIEEIEKPDIYIFDRNDNAGYDDYKSDATRVNNISKVFPVFFLLVAALVCLNTMSRMVEEDRGQMGIYKSLGFNNRQILLTYVLYASFATIFGSIIGLLLGCTILPNVIYNIYSFIYVLPELKLDNNILTMCMTTLLMFVVTLSITLYTALSVLKETPANLLRPKAPAKGKKVLIERIGFIWKRLNFSFKVTTRNIFRYKKRIFMTIVGIAGCTALTLAGLGLKDSITGIIKIQFNEITKYKATLVLDKSYQKLDKEIEEILNQNSIKDPTLIYQELYSYKINNKNNDVYLVVPNDEKEFYNYIMLQHRKDKEKIELNDEGIVITEKMASNLNAKIGDTISIYDTNNKPYQVKIVEITENYAYNYIYLTSSYYEKIFNEEVEYNMVISDIEKNANMDQISSNLLNTSRVLNVIFVNDTLEKFQDMVSNLNKIVFVILICSCLLAFIVLYNLTTINITERIREIATLKVLGFNDKEVSLYVYRETMILTVIGALIGLLLGVFLHKFVIASAEMEFIMFQQNINGISYIYAFIITMVFSFIISIFTHFKLKKINMIEALKSVE